MSEPQSSHSGEEDDTRRKFREALERKQAQSRSGASHEDGGARNRQAHGPAANKRTFRRKSG
ncbi:DUF5302 domain-containing protein [Amycolatopsis panacis]|uniref:DUF5302 domain-containing protein n=1 Tax=Amycolatopsis panacis TaxID=2340917 RepID=A0A419I680_9PSEU|nr:DUF5302 domain-containing protein [Amycolatopsis panacis]RJQ86798.1 hypothetical protein D5S19_10725 [Amycolatopsis panacis]